MKSSFARILAVVALSGALSLSGLACSDDGGGGGGGLPDGGGTVFPDAAPAADAKPDSPPPPPDGGGLPGLACSIEDVTPLFECALAECVELPTGLPDGGGLPGFDLGSLGTCVISKCFSEVLDLPPDCSACLLGVFTGGAGGIEGCISGGLPELPGLPTP